VEDVSGPDFDSYRRNLSHEAGHSAYDAKRVQRRGSARKTELTPLHSLANNPY
jgi:hypothetical protein